VGEAPLVNTTSGTVGGLVEREQMSELPLNSRDFAQLITLQPGAIKLRHQEGSAVAGFATRIAISGARTSSNAYFLDGVNVTTETGQMGAGAGGSALGVEGIREFQIVTSNYDAQYGRAAGANVIAITRSGTNNLHGSLYGYLRDDSLDEARFFDVEKPDFKRHQFGFSVGGPIVRDRTFIFGNYEGLRERLGRTVIGRVPTADARRGILPTRTVQVSPAIVPFLNLYPLPNGDIATDGTGEFINTSQTPTDQNYMTVRIDHNFNGNYSTFGRFTMDDSDRTDPDSLALFANVNSARALSGTVEFQALFSSQFVGKFRGSIARNDQGLAHIGLVDAVNDLSFIEGRPIGNIAISGISAISGLSGNTSPRNHKFTSLQGGVSFDYTRGPHSVTFGVEFEDHTMRKYEDQLLGGAITFGSVADFLTNATPRRFRMKGPDRLADPNRIYDQMYVGMYLQDDIRVKPTFTLNVGLRYGFSTIPTEREGRLSAIRNLLDPAPTVGDPWYKDSKLNFDPRVGFAWDVTGRSRTALRGGFGIFHEPVLAKNTLNGMVLLPPFWSAPDVPLAQAGGLFPFVSQAQLEVLARGPESVHSIDFEMKTPYMAHWSLGLQHTLPANLVVSASYTGTRGIDLVKRAAFDVPVPTLLEDGRTFFAASSPYLNPNYGRYIRYGTGAESWYQGLSVDLRKRMSKGLMVQGSYTLSKNIDTQSSHLSGETAGTTVMNPFDLLQDKGLADTDVRHNFSANWVYELPWGKGLSGVSRALVHGWTVNGILNLASGNPTTVVSNAALTHNLIREGNVRPDLAPGGNSNPVIGDPDQYFDVTNFVPQQRGFYGTVARNTLIGPGLVNVDLSVIKRFDVRDAHRLEFRAEVFNLLNRANFAQPDAVLFNASGQRLGSAGRITATSTSARQIQLALRYTF